ncbi:Mg-dependent DNase, partial [Saccharata proteae CBS 121410]
IGINLGDPMFRGIYHGKQAHEDDFSSVIQRALESGVRKMMVTGSDLAESTHAVEIAKQHPGLCYATVGIHPCSASTLFSSPSPSSPSTSPSPPPPPPPPPTPPPSPALLASLRTLAETSKATGHCTALGEIGLDYDRLHYTPQAQQVAAFGAQLELAPSLQLPLFLHSRAAGADFHSLLTGHLGRGLEKLQLRKKGLVHSFTGSMAEAEALLALPGIDIGVNGCSLKSEENLAVVRMLPLDRLQIETDGPWCEIRPSHASARFLDGWSPPPERKCVKKERWARGAMVKGRNEPCEIGRVAWVVARVKGVAVEEVVEAA